MKITVLDLELERFFYIKYKSHPYDRKLKETVIYSLRVQRHCKLPNDVLFCCFSLSTVMLVIREYSTNGSIGSGVTTLDSQMALKSSNSSSDLSGCQVRRLLAEHHGQYGATKACRQRAHPVLHGNECL